MPRLNYHRLQCFWAVARAGGLAAASNRLQLTQSTISSQVHGLETDLGEKLFVLVGRRLCLTEIGHVVLRYADEIFALGGELQGAITGKVTKRTQLLRVGVSQVIPKLVARKLLQPAYEMGTDVRLVCIEDRRDSLLADLSKHVLDVVLTDAPASMATGSRLFNHLLGESTVTLFAAERLAQQYRRGFPQSLSDGPMLLPTARTSMRQTIDRWFAERSIVPRVIGEFDDSALLKVFGETGLGMFPAPTVVDEAVQRQYDVRVVGHLDDIQERFFAVTADRKIKHPAVEEVCRTAKIHLRPG
jgi:LysR family transcriptional activator of nhaA